MPEDNAPILTLMREMQVENKAERLEIRADLLEIKADVRSINNRVRDNEINLARVQGLGERMQLVEVDVARVKERQNISTILTSALALIGSTIAAWLGMQK